MTNKKKTVKGTKTKSNGNIKVQCLKPQNLPGKAWSFLKSAILDCYQISTDTQGPSIGIGTEKVEPVRP